MPSADSSAALNRASLSDLAKFFLRLGTTAFGGPAAHIAIMEDELVRRRRWVSREKFLDMLGASNLIPGPSSSELAIHIGYLLGGWRGLIVAGVCFILPAACMVEVLAWAYVHFGKVPAVSGILYGIKPVVIAAILQALWGLGRTAIKTRFIAVLGLISVALSAWGLHPLLLLLIAGGAVILADQIIRSGPKIVLGPLSILAFCRALAKVARRCNQCSVGSCGSR